MTVTPLSLKDAPALIERLLPVQKSVAKRPAMRAEMSARAGSRPNASAAVQQAKESSTSVRASRAVGVRTGRSELRPGHELDSKSGPKFQVVDRWPPLTPKPVGGDA